MITSSSCFLLFLFLLLLILTSCFLLLVSFFFLLLHASSSPFLLLASCFLIPLPSCNSSCFISLLSKRDHFYTDWIQRRPSRQQPSAPLQHSIRFAARQEKRENQAKRNKRSLIVMLFLWLCFFFPPTWWPSERSTWKAARARVALERQA